MIFIVHTPKTHVAEYDIDGLPADAADADVVAAIDPDTRPDGVTAREVRDQLVDAAPPFVFARFVVTPVDDELEAAGHRIRAARDAEAAALDAGRKLALAALDAGTVSERRVALAFGVDRNTVRAWRGKM